MYIKVDENYKNSSLSKHSFDLSSYSHIDCDKEYIKLIFPDKFNKVNASRPENTLEIELAQSRQSTLCRLCNSRGKTAPSGNDPMKPLAEHSTFVLYNSLGGLSLLKPLHGAAK